MGETDFKPRADDIYQERLYAVQWMRPKKRGKGFDYEFRSVTEDDIKRERIVEEYVAKHLAEWQAKGWIPDMRIESGDRNQPPIPRARLDTLASPVQPTAVASKWSRLLRWRRKQLR